MLHTRYLRNIKTFSVLIYSSTNVLTRVEIRGTKSCVDTRLAGQSDCVHTISSFSNFHS